MTMCRVTNAVHVYAIAFKCASLLFSVLFLFANDSIAEEFPTAGRSIVAIVPFAAGGPTDRVAREAATILSRSLGTKVIVENHAGAGGTIGSRLVAQSKNDGYTILIHNIGIATAPALYPALGFSPTLDFVPIGELVDVPMVLVGARSIPSNTASELLQFLRANGSKVAFGNAGAGSASHLCGLLLISAYKLQTLNVPYKGSAPALADLVGGHTQLGCDQTTNLAGHLRAGSIKSFAAMQERRIDAFNEIPTAEEQGIKGINLKVWHALFAPKGTPKPIVDKLTRALQDVVQDDEFKRRMVEVGAKAVSLSRAEPTSLRRHLEEQVGLWTPIIRRAEVLGN